MSAQGAANGDGQGPAQGQAQGAAAEPAFGTAAWAVYVPMRLERANLAALYARRRAEANIAPELPEPLTAWEIAELTNYANRHDELSSYERTAYAFILRHKFDYEHQLAAYRAYYGIPALERAFVGLNLNENEQ
jgi:hypothetical protein